MTPAELKSTRQSLGLSAERFAAFVGVETGRTVRRWEDGTRDIPGPVIKLLWLAVWSPKVKKHMLDAAFNDMASGS